jgi:hypothetical protein
MSGVNELREKNETIAQELRLKVDDEVSDKTTHLILFSDDRTLKLLQSIVRRVCVVDGRWLAAIDDDGSLPPAEHYQIQSYVGAKRAHAGEPAPLSGLMIYFDGNDTKLSIKHLKALAKAAGATVCAGSLRAQLVVSAPNGLRFNQSRYAADVNDDADADDDDDDDPPPVVVQEDWLLDCISEWTRKDVQSYFKTLDCVAQSSIAD